MKVRHVHFVGVGGIGMSGIAEILRNQGFAVSGSDMKVSENTRHLSDLGVEVRIGHEAAHVQSADVVVYSSAVADDNPELAEARRRRIPLIPRAEMLAELMRMKDAVAVAGTHGKTTTTSMVAHILSEGGLDPTYVIGGRFGALGANAKLGSGGLLVAEADESDGTFLKLTPVVTVVTSIDPEHLDYYHDFDNVQAAFAQFMNRVPFYGLNAVCMDHPVIRRLRPQVARRVLGYGFTPLAELRAVNEELGPYGSRFTVMLREERLGDMALKVLGRHNIQNALGAVAVALELGVPFDACVHALGAFTGARRRFEVLGRPGDITLVDDYGHHPAEIRATLAAARASREVGDPGRIIAVFQPHRYTRTRDLFDEFATCFDDADHIVACEVYPAGETPIAGCDGRHLYERIARHAGARSHTFAPTIAEAVDHLKHFARPRDLVITLGAGDVNKVVYRLRDEWPWR